MRLAWLVVVVACEGRGYGERCTGDDECEGSLSCHGAFCLYTCTRDNGFRCPPQHSCFGDRGFPPLPCLRHCSSDTDCPGLPAALEATDHAAEIRDWHCSDLDLCVSR